MLKYCVWLIVLTALAAYGAVIAHSSVASTEATVQVAIDVDVTGNGDNVLGPTEACNATPLQVGDTIDVDVVVRGVPEYVPGDENVSGNSGGIVGYSFNLLFDPRVLRVDEIHAFNGPTILKAGGPTAQFVWLDYAWNRPGQTEHGPPGITGDVEASAADLHPNYEDGEGVLTRITLTAIGEGLSGLQLLDEANYPLPATIVSSESMAYSVTGSNGAVLVGPGGCSPTPSPYPTTPPMTPGPEPSPTPFLTPNPNTVVDIGIDLDPRGNGDATLGTIERCSSSPIPVGQIFDVDVVARGIPLYRPDVLPSGVSSFQIDFLFDPAIVQVEDILEFRGPSILKATGSANTVSYIDYNRRHDLDNELDGPPGRTGDARIEEADFSSAFEGGDGVLTRISLRAVAEGASRIDLGYSFDPGHLPQVSDGHEYLYRTIAANSTVIVGAGSCTDPTPAPFPTPTPSPHYTPTYTVPPYSTPTGTSRTPTGAPSVFGIPASLPRTGGPSGAPDKTEGLIILVTGLLAIASGFLLARRRRS